MSFFDLENELPGWLDEVIKNHRLFSGISSKKIIKKLDNASLESYHLVCADKGNMVNTCVFASRKHQIWKYQSTKKNMRAYGKYLKAKGNSSLQFWIGIVVEDNTITFYLWFGNRPPANIRQHLASVLDEKIDKGDYWYKKQTVNSQVPSILTQNCVYGGNLINKDELKELEKEAKNAISELLDAVEQALKNK